MNRIMYHENYITLEVNEVEIIKDPWHTKWEGRVVATGQVIVDDSFRFTEKRPKPTLERLRDAIRTHDLTYQYSDYGPSWRRGEEQMCLIQKLAKLHPEEANRLWKEKVDSTVIEAARKSFYREF